MPFYRFVLASDLRMFTDPKIESHPVSILSEPNKFFMSFGNIMPQMVLSYMVTV